MFVLAEICRDFGMDLAFLAQIMPVLILFGPRVCGGGISASCNLIRIIGGSELFTSPI